ncbi:MAG: lipid kinase [Myxococcaceae bacterium]
METPSPTFAPHPSGQLDPPRAVLIANTRSRSGRKGCSYAQEVLARSGMRLMDVQPVLKPGKLAETVQQAVRAGASLVIVGGGDGTQSAAANVLANTDVTLGVLPLGTGNDFARSLGIPVDSIDEACTVITGGAVAHVDVGVCGGRRFLNAASMGLTAEIAQRLTGKTKSLLGPLAYPVAAAKAAWRQRPFRLVLTENGRPLEIDAVQLVVGNGRFQGGGHLISPDATLVDHLLDVYAVLAPSPKSGLWSALKHWAGLFAVGGRLSQGTHLDDPRVLNFRTAAFDVQADPAQPINLDGELLGSTPTTFSVEKAALRVLVPGPP